MDWTIKVCRNAQGLTKSSIPQGSNLSFSFKPLPAWTFHRTDLQVVLLGSENSNLGFRNRNKIQFSAIDFNMEHTAGM